MLRSYGNRKSYSGLFVSLCSVRLRTVRYDATTYLLVPLLDSPSSWRGSAEPSGTISDELRDQWTDQVHLINNWFYEYTSILSGSICSQKKIWIFPDAFFCHTTFYFLKRWSKEFCRLIWIWLMSKCVHSKCIWWIGKCGWRNWERRETTISTAINQEQWHMLKSNIEFVFRLVLRIE